MIQKSTNCIEFDSFLPYGLNFLLRETFTKLLVINLFTGPLGGVVVKALRYKPAGRGFDSRWCH